MKSSKIGIARFLLIASGFLTSAIFYIFYISYRQLTFVPPPDPIGIIPPYKFLYKPEIELQLYVTGVAFVTTAGFLLSQLFGGLLRRAGEKQFIDAVHFYFRMVLFHLLLLLYLTLYQPAWWTLNFGTIFFATVVAVLGFVYLAYIFPDTFSALRSSITHLADWLWVTAMTFVFFRFLYGIMTMEFASGKIPDYLRQNDYWVFPGFGIKEFSIVSLSLVIILWILVRTTRKKIKTPRILYPVADFAVAGGVIYCLTTVYFMRPDDYVELARFNMSAIIGPVSDILAGKTLLVNSWSQYGVLNMYAVSAFMSYLPRMYTSFVWIIFGFMFAGFLLLYVAMKRWFGWFAVFAMLLIFEHIYFARSDNLIFNMQQSFVRWGLWIGMFLLITYPAATVKHLKLRRYLELVLLGINVLWAFDIGFYAVGAYSCYRIAEIFLGIGSFRKKIERSALVMVHISASLLLAVGIFSFLTLIRSGSFPHWGEFYRAASYFASGMSVYPMQPDGPYLSVLFFYGLIIIFLLHRITYKPETVSDRQIHDTAIVAYLAGLGIFQFIYYTGQSSSNGTLHFGSMPLWILLAYFLTKIPRAASEAVRDLKNIRSRLVCITTFSTTFLLICILMTIGTMNMITGFAHRVNFLYPWLDDSPNEMLHASSVSALNTYLDSLPPENRRAAIVSLETHYFLFKTRSANILDYNNAYLLYTEPQIADVGRQLYERAPEVLFVDNGYSYTVDSIMNYVRGRYIPVAQYGYLDKWVKRM